MNVTTTLAQGGSHNCRVDSSSPKFALLQAADRPASWQDQLSFLGRTVHYCTPSLKGGPAQESLAQRFNALSGECCTFALHPTGRLQPSPVPKVYRSHKALMSMQASSALHWVQALPSPRCCRTPSRHLRGASSRSLAAPITVRISQTQVRHVLNVL